MSEHPPKKVVEDSKEAKRIDALMRDAEAAKAAEVKPLQSDEETAIEGTPKEWKDKLREAVGKLTDVAGEKFDNAKEKIGGWMSERGEKMSNYLKSRSEEQDAEAEKLGWVEKSFRKLGENYNKLSTREKIGVGVALALGSGGLAAVSLPAAWAFLGGAAIQRSAGLASMFLKYEKSGLSKERAMGKAILSQVAMTAGMLVLVEGVKEGTDWLVHHWNPDEGVTPRVHLPSHAPAPEVPHAPEMPQVTVEASSGHGYEYMAKRLWEQLQDKGLDPSKYAEGSDIHKLLTADAGTIDTVVHQIASDPQHGFFNPDGTSALIGADAHMTIGADGQVHLGDAIHAPEGAATTPAYHPGAHAAPAPATVAEVASPPAEKPFSLTDEEFADRYREAPLAPVETPSARELPFTSHPARDMHLSVDDTFKTGVFETPIPAVESPATPIDRLPEEAPYPSPAVSPHESLPPFTTNADHSVTTTAFGLDVPLNEPHLYAGWEDGQVFVYGGSNPQERAQLILEYLKEHPKEVVYSAADNGEHRIPWRFIDGKMTPDLPVHKNHFFGFFRSFMSAPKPTDLKAFIK